MTSIVDRIRDDAPGMNRAFRRVSAYLLGAPSEFMHKSVQEIAIHAGVSLPTVLRYCRHYGFKGIPEFRIALAMALASSAPSVRPDQFVEPRVSDKAVLNLSLKLAISNAAVRYMETDRSLILDSGSTTAVFARQIRAVDARTILTTGLNVVEALCDAPQHTIILPAGMVRFESMSIQGPLVENTLQNMHFDTGYFGADSIDPSIGLSTFNAVEAHQSAVLMRACTRVIVLADSSKFRSPALHRICTLERIDVIVTDTGLPLEVAMDLMKRGPKVVRVDANSD